MKQRNTALSALAMYAMLVLALLLLALLGAQLYGGLTQRRSRNENARATLAYVQARVLAADADGGVCLARGPEGDALALTLDESGYEVLIYCWQGQLYEQLSPAGTQPQPENAQPVADCAALALAWQGDGVLAITADGQQALAALRSGKEAAA